MDASTTPVPFVPSDAQNMSSTGVPNLGVATVWREEDESFYEALLLRKLSSEDALRESLRLSMAWEEGKASPLFPAAPRLDESIHTCGLGADPCAACQAAIRG
jgi:hypothetical protein